MTLNGYGELLGLKQFDPWTRLLSSVRFDDAFCRGMCKNAVDLTECAANAILFLGNDSLHPICASDEGEMADSVSQEEAGWRYKAYGNRLPYTE